MIDARDQVLSTPPPHVRRRSGAPSRRPQSGASGSLRLARVFSNAKVKPFDQIEWEKRTAEITDDSGKVNFKQ
jgi:ribonucleoside-diphosphate reductase alpha chain